MTNFQLEKFDQGPTYFVKSDDPDNKITKIVAVANIQEVKDHAQYFVNVVLCDNYATHQVPIHGSFLNLHSILQICLNLFHGSETYTNIVKTADLPE